MNDKNLLVSFFNTERPEINLDEHYDIINRLQSLDCSPAKRNPFEAALTYIATRNDFDYTFKLGSVVSTNIAAFEYLTKHSALTVEQYSRGITKSRVRPITCLVNVQILDLIERIGVSAEAVLRVTAMLMLTPILKKLIIDTHGRMPANDTYKFWVVYEFSNWLIEQGVYPNANLNTLAESLGVPDNLLPKVSYT